MNGKPEPGQAMNLLVVDDDRFLNRFLVTYFREKGHSATSLADPSKAEAWVEKNPCDAVILDLGMPGIDGLALIPIIRSHRPELPIVIFTGYGYDEEFMQAVRYSGANGYVSKALGPGEVYRTVMRVTHQTASAS